MALQPYNDNLLILAPKPVDSRWSKFSGGTTRPYNDISEFISSQAFGARYPTQLFFIKDPEDENKSILYILDKNKDPQRLIPDVSGLQDKTDNSLNTTNKTIVGGINEVKAKADSADAKAIVAQEDAEDAYDEAISKIPIAQKGAVGGVPNINKVQISYSISEIRALNVNNFVTPTLYVSDKGKEGVFYYDFSDTTSADDGANVLVTSDGKRLKRPIETAVKAWHYGLKGDGVTDDSVAFQNMINSITSNTTILFGGRPYRFDTPVNLVGKRFITFKGDGCTFMGTCIIGDTDPLASVFECNFRSIGIRFSGSGFVNNGYELCNIRGFYIQNTHATGLNAVVYVRPINKFQHVNRGFIEGTSGGSGGTGNGSGCNYLFYADNPINTAPYTDIQMTTGDVEIAGNADHRALIANVVGIGVDGITMTGNTFFMPNAQERSQIKKQNVRMVASNWIILNGNKFFESGEEGVLFEKCRNWATIGCHFAWSGQKDITKSFGFRLTGGGYTDPNYTTGVIANNLFDRIPGSDIKIDGLSTGVTIHDNRHSATGNPSFYYGDGTFPPGSPNATPSVNSVPHYAIDVDANTKRILVHDNFSDNVDFNFSFDDSLNLLDLDLLRHWNNIGRNGVAESRAKTLTSIPVSGTVDTGGTNNVLINVASGVIKNLSNAHVGDVIMIYNANATALTIENNANIQLSTNDNSLIYTQNGITLQKRIDKWYELGRTNNGFGRFGKGSGSGFATDGGAPLLDISTGDFPGVVVGAENGLTTRTNNTNKFFKLGMVPYAISQVSSVILSILSDISNTSIFIGGGSSAMNSATSVDIYTGSNNTTRTGVRRLAINSAGLVRSFFGFLGVSGADNIVPIISKGNSTTQTANLFSVQNSAGVDQVGVGADGSLILESASGVSKDTKFQRSGFLRWILRMTVGDDVQLISRNNDGTFLAILINFFRLSGNVAIGDSADIPSAKFAINSTTQGFSTPRMTTAQRDAIPSPAPGLHIENIDTEQYERYNSTLSQWVPVSLFARGLTSGGTTEVVMDVLRDSYVFTGTTATWIAPVVSGNAWRKIYVKNRGTGILTINSSSVSSDFYLNSAIGSITIEPGSSVLLLNDGTYWNVQALKIKGSIKPLTSATTLLLSDYGSNGVVTIYADATGGAFTITLLPSAIDQGLTTKIVKVDSSANTVTVKGSGSELINNANTDTTLSTQNSSYILESNGTKHFKF